MRKLLAGLLLSLRWLLVPLLPVLGLAIGALMMPEAKPRWYVPIEGKSNCLGIITRNGQSSLLFHHGLSKYREVPAIHGIDLVTGDTSIIRAEEKVDYFELARIPGTSLALHHKTIGSHPAFKLYDWEKNIDVHQGFLPDSNPYLNSLTYQGHTLAATILQNRSTIGFWHFNEYKPTDPVEIKFPNGNRFDIQLSADEAWAIVSYLVRSPVAGSSASIIHVKLVDTLQGKIVQDLSSDNIHAARWHPVDNSILALREDGTTQQLFWQRYQLVNNNIVPRGTRVLSNKNSFVINSGSSPIIILASDNSMDPLRRKLSELVGREGQSILDRCWPVATTVDVYQSSNGEMLQSFTIPHYDVGLFDIKAAYPDPSGQGVVLNCPQHYSYWEFNPTARWYPRLGLALGIVLAILLAWFNLRRTREVKAAHA